MTKADFIFKDNIQEILTNGVWSENARPVYADGSTANSKYITNVFEKYDLAGYELPITTLRPIYIKKAIEEMLWIYQDQSNNLDVLADRGVTWWDSWEVDNREIGQRYGATVSKHHIIDKLLYGLAENPWNRRNIINLWQYEDFDETPGLLPCAFQIMFDVRKVGDDMYLDAVLTQRSSDMLVANHINKMQYVALQMMIAKHFGWKAGTFSHLVGNLHIYSNQWEQAEELLKRKPSQRHPVLKLDVPDGTDFYDIKASDFVLIDYEPVKPQIKFPDLAV
jgi:thymidylate synthase